MKFSAGLIAAVAALVDTAFAAKGENGARANKHLKARLNSIENAAKSIYANRPFQVTNTKITGPVETALSNLGFKQRGVNGTYAASTAADWYLAHEYSGDSFFDNFDFLVGDDPTRGNVNYVSSDDAFRLGLAGTTDTGSHYFRVDNYSDVPAGGKRNSVRIGAKDKMTYPSIVVMDANHMGYGKTTWSAFWVIGDSWPNGGEIDLVEGTNLQQVNQIGAHTKAGCTLATPMPFGATANVLTNNCDAFVNSNQGCVSRAVSGQTYGQGFADIGGGVYAGVWDVNGFGIYFFPRGSIPQDIYDGAPNPSTWAPPLVQWGADDCNPQEFFTPLTVTFDITICGDWATTTWHTEYNFPGECTDGISDKTNYDPAYYDINYVQIYKGTSQNA